MSSVRCRWNSRNTTASLKSGSCTWDTTCERTEHCALVWFYNAATWCSLDMVTMHNLRLWWLYVKWSVKKPNNYQVNFYPLPYVFFCFMYKLTVNIKPNNTTGRYPKKTMHLHLVCQPFSKGEKRNNRQLDRFTRSVNRHNQYKSQPQKQSAYQPTKSQPHNQPGKRAKMDSTEKQTYRQTKEHTNKQTDRTDRQANELTHEQTNGLNTATERHTNKNKNERTAQTDRQTNEHRN